VVVWDSGNGGGTSGFLQNMAKTLPPMMHVMRDIAGVELPGYMGKLGAEDAATPPVAPGDDSAVTKRVVATS